VEEARTAAHDGDVTYNQVAGERNLDRIGALSDGLFAIAMTIIVLEIRVPALETHTDAALLGAIGQLGPRFVTYFLSFLTLGIFWNAQHAQLNYVARADRTFAWLQLVYLSFVALMPFATSLLAESIDLRVAFLVYWLNLYLLGVALYVVWWYAIRADLLTADANEGVRQAFKRRVVVYQAAYAIGAVVALLIGTTPAIVFVLLTQLNSAIAPRLPWVSRV
jgi:TMEM175 potassium channel family protein